MKRGWTASGQGMTLIMRGGTFIALLVLGGLLFLGCAADIGSDPKAATPKATLADPVALADLADPALEALAKRAASLFGPLPSEVPNPENIGTPEMIDLGRMLYYEPRLSKNHDISCNSCHMLDAYGVDGQPTSPGHRGARGTRNSPTVYNAALHLAQFWDGREPDVEAQAKGPVLNPIEMASASPEAVVALMNSIPGYVDAFGAAFPGESDPVTYDNMARAIGAFERKLMTPSRFDAFMAGDVAALDEQERRGLTTFLSVGCNTCHTSAALGGQLYRKLGFIFPYETEDIGRENVTGEAANRYEFKVPSLRNVAKTGPYFHDGSIETLDEAVKLMGYHQLAQTLDQNQVADIVAFLESLTGELPASLIAKPTLPASGLNTPAPDPS